MIPFGNMYLGVFAVISRHVAASALGPGGAPLPTARQLDFMDLEISQFMHFGIPTFWDPPIDYLYTDNPTYHDCGTTSMDHTNQTGAWWPCLDPLIFNPTDFSAEDWMQASVAMGVKEICLTAHHEGGFALWPSNYTNYSVAKSLRWRGGKGDVLREFADAANRWGVKICYYLNVQADGYQAKVAKATVDEFLERQLGMVREVLTQYGPVNRFWFDGTQMAPDDIDLDGLWDKVFQEIRTVSPATMISPGRGDVCASTGSLYNSEGPEPNSTTSTHCKSRTETSPYFQPTEMHGITMQEGPDGNSDEKPTYWFWHEWACAGNKTGCPWVGHGNASRVFDSMLVTVGHGAVLNINIPPDRSGRMNASVAEVMRDVGRALNDTFGKSVAQSLAHEADCGPGVVELELPSVGELFDYIVTMEDLKFGQHVANYSVEFIRDGSDKWEILVPPVWANNTFQDRPDGHDPRDQYIGHKRIDFPEFPDADARTSVSKVRLNCLKSMFGSQVFIRSFSLHRKSVPWEQLEMGPAPIIV